MDIDIYIDGKLDRRHDIKRVVKRTFWTSYVWLDCYVRNKRFPKGEDEVQAARSIAYSFAVGARRPF